MKVQRRDKKIMKFIKIIENYVDNRELCEIRTLLPPDQAQGANNRKF